MLKSLPSRFKHLDRFWRDYPMEQIHSYTSCLLSRLTKHNDGPFDYLDISDLIQDILELPHRVGVKTLSRGQCHYLIIALRIRKML